MYSKAKAVGFIGLTPPPLDTPLEHTHWIFLVSKFSYLLFSNPTYKIERETANMWELLI
jgi:hypothetical protein